jgi:hypothetical protein
VDGKDLLDKFHRYIKEGDLIASTLLVTFDISSLISLRIAGDSPEELQQKVDGIAVDTLTYANRSSLQVLVSSKYLRYILLFSAILGALANNDTGTRYPSWTTSRL